MREYIYERPLCLHRSLHICVAGNVTKIVEGDVEKLTGGKREPPEYLQAFFGMSRRVV